MLFVILQKYDFSSKSQRVHGQNPTLHRCLWYCKSTIFQANHNLDKGGCQTEHVVCDTAKVRFFKQITTQWRTDVREQLLFVILQKYDFSSKSQLDGVVSDSQKVVCDTAKVRFFKQITTATIIFVTLSGLFVILQKYDFSSKSQPIQLFAEKLLCCLWYCKSTIFQANHNTTRLT